MSNSHSFPLERTGFTLPELAMVVLLMNLALAALVPAARSQMDRMATLGAREELAGLLQRARFEAVSYGGAVVRFDADSCTVDLEAGGEVSIRAALQGEYGVEMTLSGDRSESEVFFDQMGLGRVASQTVLLTRGRAEAGIVISSYGRVVRR